MPLQGDQALSCFQMANEPRNDELGPVPSTVDQMVSQFSQSTSNINNDNFDEWFEEAKPSIDWRQGDYHKSQPAFEFTKDIKQPTPPPGNATRGGPWIEGLITEVTVINHTSKKRKRSGRPPTNGFMSKRRWSQLTQEVQDIETESLITEETTRLNLPTAFIGEVVKERKGRRGRPPKDGIMSKRQRSQLIKRAREIHMEKFEG